jgi:hypothetical protein
MTAASIDASGAGRIELKLRTVAQLFNTLDPSPFRERDLAKEAEDYIVDYAEDVPKGVPIDIVLHLPAREYSQSTSSEIASAIKDYFGLRSHETTREMEELFRTGRFSLLVGLIVLSVCLTLGLFLAQTFQKGPFPDIFREGFLILGWVAIWRPSEIFLYAWPPLLRRRRLFQRLMQARVTVEGDGSG